jgi:hypothetical protein
MSHAVSRISSTEGLRTLWRGVASVIAGAGPAHAVQFGTLEGVKEMLGKQEGSLAWASTGLLYCTPETMRLAVFSNGLGRCKVHILTISPLYPSCCLCHPDR